MAVVVGARLTDNVEQAIRKIDMVPTIKELEPDATPLTVLTTRMDSADAVNPEFSWMEDGPVPRFDAVNDGTGMTDSDTTMVVDNGSYFGLNELWKVTRTAEIFRVTAIATNSLTVVRGIGGGAAAILDNDEIMKLSVASEENALAPIAQSRNPVKKTNYTQIVTHTVEASETWIHSANETRPIDWVRQVDKKMTEHKLGLESIYLHGKPSEDLTGAPRRTSGGVLHFATANRIDAGGQLTQAEFFGGFPTVFRRGNKNAKVAFASRLATGVINQYAMNNIRVVQGDNNNEYGLNIMRFVSPFGTLKVTTHDMLEGAVYGGYIVVADLSNIRKRPLRGRDTHIVEHTEAKGQDGRQDKILTEIGLEIAQDETHTVYTGITS